MQDNCKSQRFGLTSDASARVFGTTANDRTGSRVKTNNAILSEGQGQ